MAGTETLAAFYRRKFDQVPEDLGRDSGHVNVFTFAELARRGQPTASPRRDFYKIIFIRGNFALRCAGESHEVNGAALLFVNPDVPYQLARQNGEVPGYLCVFKAGFFSEHLRGRLTDLPVFAPEASAPYRLTGEAEHLVEAIFSKMHQEVATANPFKYDLLRAYVSELVYQILKWEPAGTLPPPAAANARLTAVFRDLLERQFPITSPAQQCPLRSAATFAAQLHVHVNHLNRAVRAITGKTTTTLILERLLSEAKALLVHTDWHVADIGYCLGFEEAANFSHFFKKQTALTPRAYRQQLAG